MPGKLKTILVLWMVSCGLGVLLWGTMSIGGFVSTAVEGKVSPPEWIVLLMMLIFGVGVNGYWLFRCMQLLKGKNNKTKFLKIMAGLNLLGFPVGTIFGVATFVVLGDAEVRTYLNK